MKQNFKNPKIMLNKIQPKLEDGSFSKDPGNSDITVTTQKNKEIQIKAHTTKNYTMNTDYDTNNIYTKVNSSMTGENIAIQLPLSLENNIDNQQIDNTKVDGCTKDNMIAHDIRKQLELQKEKIYDKLKRINKTVENADSILLVNKILQQVWFLDSIDTSSLDLNISLPSVDKDMLSHPVKQREKFQKRNKRQNRNSQSK
eukprot:GAHX01002789.1.p1 GENE.GAHX01002789.1~~GAHX01002789.1.p1  ORF type:complete len:200 (+),score=42.61 GAHX01002789.1:2-601(+)